MSEARSRRTRAKVVTYNTEQQFSDDDIFEDNFDEEPTSARKKTTRPRKSNVGASQDDGFNGHGSSLTNKPKPIYTERGYDATLLPLRERFSFEPEFEPDGTSKIELIVGRRPIEDTKDRTQTSGEGAPAGGDQSDNDEDDYSEEISRPTRRVAKTKKKRNLAASKIIESEAKDEEGTIAQSEMDYEYLLKYKGRSYLHLEWKTAADLESMNKHAKTIYRRFLKKLAAGTDEDLEDPTFDPAFTEPGKILAEEDHEIMVELSDKELLKWEKERETEMGKMEDEEDVEEEKEEEKKETDAEKEAESSDEQQEITHDGEAKEVEPPGTHCNPSRCINSLPFLLSQQLSFHFHDIPEIGEPNTLTIDDLRRICKREEPYYPTFPGSDNPYRDGYITEPPKKPRPSYLFYQGIYRSVFGRKNPDASLPEVMQMLGDTWRGMTDAEQAPYIQIAKEEADQYEKEKALLERAQRPSEMWQPIRRCQAVLDRLCNDPFAAVFLEPVDTDVYTDYLEMIESPMDLGTVRETLKNRKYQAPEAFARDVRKVSRFMFA